MPDISKLKVGDEVYVRAVVLSQPLNRIWVQVRTHGDAVFAIVESDLAPVQPLDIKEIKP